MPPSSLSARRAVTTDRRAAFTALFEEHWSAIHSYAHRRVVPTDDAHDVAAETFAIAWRRFDDLPAGHEVGWLYRTAANVVANRSRGGRRQERLVARLAGEPSRVGPDASDEATEDLVLRAALADLRDEDAELLTLVAWDGLSNEVLAQVFDISPNAAALRVSRARARLADAIAAHEATTSDRSGHEVDGSTGTAGPDGRSTS